MTKMTKMTRMSLFGELLGRGAGIKMDGHHVWCVVFPHMAHMDEESSDPCRFSDSDITIAEGAAEHRWELSGKPSVISEGDGKKNKCVQMQTYVHDRVDCKYFALKQKNRGPGGGLLYYDGIFTC